MVKSIFFIDVLCFSATFNNISAISVYVVEEAEVSGENYRPWTSNWYTLSLAAVNRVHLSWNLQIGARTHAVLVIGLNELLDPLSHTGPLVKYIFLFHWH